MSLATGVYTLLSTNAGVSGLVGTRIYPDVAPEGSAWPSIVYQEIDAPRWNALDNASDTPHARWQFACWAENVADAIALRAAVMTALAGYSGTTSDGTTIQSIITLDQRTSWDWMHSTMGLYRCDIDFEIVYQE